MLVLIEVGEDAHRETTPTTGFSVSSEFNFLGLYAKPYREVELGLCGVSPPSSIVPSAEEETPPGSCLPWDRVQLHSGEGLSWLGQVFR